MTVASGNMQIAEKLVQAPAQAANREVRFTPEPLTRLRMAIENARHHFRLLDRFVSDLLDVSRSRVGRLEIKPELTDLQSIVAQVIRDQRAAWPGRDIKFDVVPAGPGVVVRADSDRIGQVVTNYLTNALKYSSSDKPVSVQVRLAKGMARVDVRDVGPGLSAKQQERLFERYYRVPGIEVRSGTSGGLGLGLYLCRTIVERHGGQVGVESAPGKGSDFWFTLPLVRARES
jgi:signal transduction histidine kinase